MSDWTQHSDRIAARDSLVAELANNGTLRAQCIKYPHVARKTFARLGGFDLEEDRPGPGAIPIDSEFRVFDGKILQDREKVVIIVLDRPAMEITDDKKIWQCTYFPYIQLFEGEDKAETAKKD